MKYHLLHKTKGGRLKSEYFQLVIVEGKWGSIFDFSLEEFLEFPLSRSNSRTEYNIEEWLNVDIECGSWERVGIFDSMIEVYEALSSLAVLEELKK